MKKNLPTIWEIQVRSLGWEDTLDEGMAFHSSMLAWKIPWTEEPGRLQRMGSRREVTTKLLAQAIRHRNREKIKWQWKCKEEEALQIAEKSREAKGKGEKERYTDLNAEFQRIARRDKKAFLSDQCKEIEENNRMGKTRDLKKTKDSKGTFHAKMGSIKDRNSMDLTEPEDIKKCWQDYTEELYKKDLDDLDNHDAVITHLEPASWNVKSSGP